VRLRYAKTDGAYAYYAMKSENIIFSRLDVPQFRSYYGTLFRAIWKGVDNAINYTLNFYYDNVKIYEKSVVPAKDASGQFYSEFDPINIFPNETYSSFEISVSADGNAVSKHVYLGSGESERVKVNYIGKVTPRVENGILKWNAIPEAVSYTLSIVEENAIIDAQNANTSKEYKFTTGGDFNVMVHPNPALPNSYGGSTKAEYHILEVPNVTAFTQVTKGATISWAPDKDANGYNIAVYNSTNGELVFSDYIDDYRDNIYTITKANIGVGTYDVKLYSSGDNIKIFNSPAAILKLQRLAMPDTTVEIVNDIVKVSIVTKGKDIEYDVNKVSIASWYDENNDKIIDGKRVISFKPTNTTNQDISFDIAVKSKTSNPSEASSKTLCIIDSDECITPITLLANPSGLHFVNNEKLEWNKSISGNYDIKLDDGKIITYPNGIEQVLLSDLHNGILQSGNHTIYLRRQQNESDGVLASAFVSMDFYKNSVPNTPFINDNRIMSWESGNSPYISGYLLQSQGVNKHLENNSYNGVQSDILNVGKNEGYSLSYTVIAEGDYTGAKYGLPIINSAPSEPCVATRIKDPTISICDGIITWQYESGIDSFILKDGDLVLKAGSIFNSYSVNSVEEGDHVYTVTACGNGKIFDSAPSNALQVHRLKKPTLTKVTNGTDYYLKLKLNEGYIDSLANSYLFSIFETNREDISISTDFALYRYIPDKNGNLSAGKYYAYVQALGNGITTITSVVSEDIEYEKLETPNTMVNYANLQIKWTAQDIVDSFDFSFNGQWWNRADKTSENFKSFDIPTEIVNVGINKFKIRARSLGNVPSNYETIDIRKLEQPCINQTSSNLNWKDIIYAENYAYAVNNHVFVSTALSKISITELQPIIGWNEIAFYAYSSSAIASDITIFRLYKLDTPQPFVNWNSENIEWSADSESNVYEYTLNGIASSTNAKWILPSYRDGDNTFKIKATAPGCVDSDTATLQVYKLFAPEITRDYLDLSWNTPIYTQNYVCTFDGKSEILESNTCTVSEVNLAEGQHSFSVQAKAQFRISSNVTTHVFKKLEHPIVSRNGNTINWNNVTGNQLYRFSLNGNDDETVTTQLVLSQNDLKIGINEFVITANAANCIPSDPITFNIRKLAMPIVSRDYLSFDWEAIDYATDYVFTLNGKKETIYDNFLTLNDNKLSIGENKIIFYAENSECIKSDSFELSFVKLDIPVLSRNALDVTWQNVNNATKYSFSIGTQKGTTVDSEFKIVDSCLSVGANMLSVQAVADGCISSDYGKMMIIKLGTPVLAKNGYQITWQPITNCGTYKYSINENQYNLSNTALQLTNSDLIAGDNVIKVWSTATNCITSDVAEIVIFKPSTPVITIDGLNLSWGSVNGASEYIVMIENDSYTTSNTSYAVLGNQLKVGANVVRVKAKSSQGIMSEVASGTITKLATPILSRTGYEVSWQSIECAEKYKCTIGERVFFTEETSLTILENEILIGNNVLSVSAYAENCIQSNPASLEFIRLGAPTLKLKDLVVSWDYVENASSYDYSVGSQSGNTAFNSFVIDRDALSVGENIIQVKAKGYNCFSLDTSTISIVVLETPVLQQDGLIIKWGEIKGADSYHVVTQNSEFIVTDKSFSLEKDNLTVGENIFTIFAEGDGVVASLGSTITIICPEKPTASLDNNIVTWQLAKDVDYIVKKNNDIIEITTMGVIELKESCTITIIPIYKGIEGECAEINYEKLEEGDNV